MPVAPLWMDNSFQVLGTLGPGGVLQLRAFGEEPETDLLDWPREASDRIPGLERFSLSGYVGGDNDQPLSFALPFENSLAFVRPTSVLWLSREGKPLKQQPLVWTRYGWSHRDGAHVRTAVGQLGELRRLHVEEDGVWAELLGRIELPAGHVAGLAVHLSGSRYLVFTQQEPEMRLTGFTDERITDEGLEQLSPSNGPLHAFVVEAPPTGIVDRDWTLRQVHANVGDGVLRVCVPAGSDWRIDRMRVGHVALSSFVSRDPGRRGPEGAAPRSATTAIPWRVRRVSGKRVGVGSASTPRGATHWPG